MTENKPRQRVFFALWPDAELRAALAVLAGSIPADGRPVPAAHFHLTLAFPGTVGHDLAAAMSAHADGLRPSGIRLSLDQLGWFRRPRVAWIGPARNVPELEALAAQLRRVCEVSGAMMEDRPFRPHVTLRRDVRRFDAIDVEPLVWQPREMVLIESGRNGHPGAYRVLRSWPVAPD